MALPPFPNQGEWSKPDHFRDVAETQPSMMLGDHPALAKSKLRMANRDEIGDLYRRLMGKEPPTLQEFVAKLRSEGRPIPPHIQAILDEAQQD